MPAIYAESSGGLLFRCQPTVTTPLAKQPPPGESSYSLPVKSLAVILKHFLYFQYIKNSLSRLVSTLRVIMPDYNRKRLLLEDVPLEQPFKRPRTPVIARSPQAPIVLPIRNENDAAGPS